MINTYFSGRPFRIWMLLIAFVPAIAMGQIGIPGATAVTENFASLGASATASLPSNWKMSAAGAGSSAGYGTAGNLTAVNAQASSGSPTAGARYNWGTTGGTDRSIGFMTSGSYASPNSIMAYYRNTSGVQINDLVISFDIERFRVNSSTFSLAFFTSTDGSTWTARTTGDVATTVFATGTSAYDYSGATIASRTVTLTGINIANNGDLYVRWVFTNTGGTNSQGLALDNVSLTATLASSSTATLSNITQPTGSVLQGAANVVLSGFTLGATASSNFTAVTLSGSGTATATDITSVRVYRDNDGNGAINGADASVSGSGVAYAASMPLTITGETGITTTRNYLVVANIAGVGVSTAGRTVSVGVGSGAFTTTASANSGSASGSSRTIAAPPGTSLLSFVSGASAVSSLTNTQGAAVTNFSFTIWDDGLTPATDAAALQMSQIVLNAGTGNTVTNWSTAILGAELSDGTNSTTTATIGTFSITFAAIANTTGTLGYIADDASKTYTLKIWLKTDLTTLKTVIDGQNFVFRTQTADVISSGSQIKSGQDINSGSGNNVVNVTATALAFVQQPSNTTINANMAPAVSLQATDANGNRDLGFTGTIQISSSGTMASSPLSASAVAGLVSFGTINHTVAASPVVLTAVRNPGTPDWSVSSSSFDITVQAAGILLLEENFMATNGVLTDNGWSQIGATSTSPIVTGLANGLSYPAYGSSEIGNAAVIGTSGQDVYRTFTSQNPGSGTLTVYYSALVSVSSAVTAGDYFLTLGESSTFSGGSTFRGRLYVKRGSSASKIVFGVATNTTITYGAAEYNTGTSYLVAVKHVFSTSASTASLFINPSAMMEPAAADVVSSVASSVSTGLDAIALRQGAVASAPAVIVDGIRVATNWGSLIGNPQYNSPATIAEGNYNDISVLPGNTLTLSGDVSVNGEVSNTGVIAIGSNMLTLNGTVTGSGTLTGGSTSDLTIGATGITVNMTAGSRTLRNVIIGTGVNAGMSLGSDLAISPAGSISFNAAGAKSLTTTGYVLTLQSTAAGTAYIGNTNGATITGAVSAERFVASSGRRWRFLASCVTNATLEDWRSSTYITGAGSGTVVGTLNSNGFDATPNNAPSVFTYNEAIAGSYNNGWEEVTNNTSSLTNIALTPGKGYRLFIRGDRSDPGRLTGAVTLQNALTLKLTGTVYTGNIVLPVSYTNTMDVTNDGWNLLGNPYPAAYDWTAFYNDGSHIANIDPTVYILDAGSNSYKSYNATSTGTLTNGIIPSGSSFWIKANAASPSLTFTENFKSTGVPMALHKTATRHEQLNISMVLDSVNRDEYILTFINGSVKDDDAYDIKKLMNASVNISSVSGDGIYHTVDARPELAVQDTVQLYVSGVNGDMHFAFTSVPRNGKYYFLLDALNGSITLIDTTTYYPFTINNTLPATSGTRFKIIIANSASLPVTYQQFSATKMEREVLLSWTTASEINNSAFEIERSNDNLTYVMIGSVKGQGTSVIQHRYRFADEQPLLSGTNYYRLKQVDADGHFSYSPVQAVSFDSFGEAGMIVQAWPNPVKDLFTIEVKAAGVYSAEVYGISGNNIGHYTVNVGADRKISLVAAPFPAGMYIVKIKDETGSSSSVKMIRE